MQGAKMSEHPINIEPVATTSLERKQNKFKKIGIGFFIVTLLIGGTYGFYYLVNKSILFGGTRAQVEVDWRLFGQLDYVTGFVPDELKKLNGTLIKSPGFMVPLEDNMKRVSQFLLVPSPQACIHVPPPPPNQMVLINMKDGAKVEYGPIWVHGRLKIKTVRTQYGDVSFELEGLYVEPYLSN
jgi:hypothetical protein